MPTAQEVRSWYNRRYASLGLDSMRPFEAYHPYSICWMHGRGPRCSM
jgi:hypothetical protein